MVAGVADGGRMLRPVNLGHLQHCGLAQPDLLPLPGIWRISIESCPRYHVIHDRLRDAVGDFHLQAFRSQSYFFYSVSQQPLLVCRAAEIEYLARLPSVGHGGLEVDLRRLRLDGRFAGKFLTLLHQLPESAVGPAGILQAVFDGPADVRDFRMQLL